MAFRTIYMLKLAAAAIPAALMLSAGAASAQVQPNQCLEGCDNYCTYDMGLTIGTPEYQSCRIQCEDFSRQYCQDFAAKAVSLRLKQPQRYTKLRKASAKSVTAPANSATSWYQAGTR